MKAHSVAGWLVLTLLLAAAAADGADLKGSEMQKRIRKPAVAGQFYTADPKALRLEIEGYLEQASPPPVEGDLKALICPHAGYVYSGQVAAAGYSLLRKGQFETVVVISPCHVEFFRFASVYDGDGYGTPLGVVDVDRELAADIASRSDLIRLSGEGHGAGQRGRGEHSLEVQIPFLQVALGDFRIVPIVMGEQSEEIIEALGGALSASLEGRNALIVASTDLSHFHDDASARRLDDEFIRDIKAFDPVALMRSIGSGKTEACGAGPAASAMIAAAGLGADRCTVLEYANSGDVSGDRGSVVGYVSAAFTAAGDDAAGDRGGSVGNDVSRETRIFLLRHARNVIREELGLETADLERPDDPVLEEKRGGFVTLDERGRLRGCIGYIEAVKPLLETVTEMARAAAFNDYRFQPVTGDEVDDLAIEISVLSPVRAIKDPREIEVGRDGIIISASGHRGLLLPQVAVEYGWDRDTFLDQTCVKAGLPKGCWKEPGTTIEIFSAEIFSEEEMGLR